MEFIENLNARTRIKVRKHCNTPRLGVCVLGLWSLIAARSYLGAADARNLSYHRTVCNWSEKVLYLISLISKTNWRLYQWMFTVFIYGKITRKQNHQSKMSATLETETEFWQKVIDKGRKCLHERALVNFAILVTKQWRSNAAIHTTDHWKPLTVW